MTDWYSASSPAAQARVLAAWGDAPIENAEVLGFILDTAREQVEAYAPAAPIAPPAFAPATLTWPNGWKVELTRAERIVTGLLTVGTGAAPAAALAVPAGFEAAGDNRQQTYNSASAPTLVLTLNEVAATGAPGVSVAGAAPVGTTLTILWVTDPGEPVETIPGRWVYAQLQQAKNLYTAGTVRSGGEYGDDQFSYQPRPLDKTIRTIIRPVDGTPHVL